MGDIGTLLMVEDLTGQGADEVIRQLQVAVNGPADVRTCELVRGAGNDFKPTLGSRIYILDAGHGWKLGFVLNDGIDPEAADGEYILYSTDAGGLTKMARIKLGADGNIEIVTCPAGVDMGKITLNALTGQVAINDNFTVDV